MNTGSDVYGARVTPSGTVLDPAGIAISHALADQYAPAVASDGTNFLVVWADQRNSTAANPMGPPANTDIYGSRVGFDGQVLDSAGFLISGSPGWQELPAVAFGGNGYLVVWDDQRGTTSGANGIYGVRVSQGVADTAEFPISGDVQGYSSPRLAAAGTGVFLVVSQGSRSDVTRVFGQFVATTDSLKISGIWQTPGGAILSWVGQVGTTYRVQYATDIEQPKWVDLIGDVLSTNVLTIKLDPDAIRAARRFYRVLGWP